MNLSPIPEPGYYYFYCSHCQRWAGDAAEGAARYYPPEHQTVINHLKHPYQCYCDKDYPVRRVDGEQLRLDFWEVKG